ncbi:Abi family protein [Microbacterium sp. NPDC076911]|uniref:Abi family protein n=1 Tax=Microbacterium sp. NPDC076911 TaxID=3154958 RepID=UPI00344ACCE1
MTEKRPYLTPEKRTAYLVDRGYIESGELSDEAKSFLARTNFHYFLGYARNFRKLRRDGLIDGDDRIDRVIRMVQLDHQISTRLFTALRTLEWRLRSALVDHHCQLFSPAGCFLKSDHFVVMNPDAAPVDVILRDQIARSREPFVLGEFEKYETKHGRTWRDSPRKMAGPDQLAAMQDLPIWAAVDGWTLGLLERIVTETKSTKVDDQERWLWKDVAGTFGVSNTMFHTQLGSVIVLRNLVAHHSRLWMRPTTVSPKKPKIYVRSLRDVDAKSMYVLWMTLASFLRSAGGDRELMDDLDALIALDPLYELGVKHPLSSAELVDR